MPRNVLITITLIVPLLCLSAPQGNFRGKIVGIAGSDSQQKWIYVEGGHRNVRRVDITHATVRYSAGVKPNSRAANPAEALVRGAEVEVVATQDGSGEWKASSVRILAAP